MLMLSELNAAFPRIHSEDGFFNDPGPMLTDVVPLLPAAYVLSTRVSSCGSRIDDYLEHVTDDLLVADCAAISLNGLTAPRVETRIGFLVGAPNASREKASTPIDYIAAAFPALRLVADCHEPKSGCESETFAIAVGAPSIRRSVLRDSLATLNRNGRVIAAGEDASMRHSPCAGIVAAAQMLTASGSALRRGQVLLTGSMHSSVVAKPGDHFRADVLGLGSVCIRCDE